MTKNDEFNNRWADEVFLSALKQKFPDWQWGPMETLGGLLASGLEGKCGKFEIQIRMMPSLRHDIHWSYFDRMNHFFTKSLMKGKGAPDPDKLQKALVKALKAEAGHFLRQHQDQVFLINLLEKAVK